MLIPQSLAYAMLAGLLPEVGLYASIAPLIAHVARHQQHSVCGPVAITSLINAALAEVAQQGTADYLTGAQHRCPIRHHAVRVWFAATVS